MGWLILLCFVAGSFSYLRFTKRCTRQALEICAAALLVGMAGYAWQGSPDIPGNSVGARN